jgi:hypothetical protein
MADRFPLIVNQTSQKVEELVSGDNLDLTGNGISVNGSSGSPGQYLKSTGGGLTWDTPGDVYLSASQTLENKTLIGAMLSGTLNTFVDIPNSALVNSQVTINGSTVSLGGSVTVPDENTTYSLSAIDGALATKKSIRLTAANPASTADVTLVAGNNVSLGRIGNEITIESSFTDTNTVTTLASSNGGTAVDGNITLSEGNNVTITQSGTNFTIASSFVNTITRIRGTSSGTYFSGDWTIEAGNAVGINQSGNTITVSSTDTVTRVGNTALSVVSGDVIITGGGDTVVSQTGNTITVTTNDADTITTIEAASGPDFGAVSGAIVLQGGADTTVSQNGNTFTISTTDTDTQYTAAASGGLSLSTTQFSLKNAANLQAARILKWDGSNNQLSNSIISDDGSTVTIGGDLTVTGTQTIINTATLQVADNEIELRRGNNLVGTNSGLRVNRITDGSGNVTNYTSLSWFEAGSYWSTFDGSIRNRLVTENETQILANKTLNSPTLVTPVLGIATVTTINGLSITNAPSAILTVASGKTLRSNNTLTFTGTDGSSVNFGSGGQVVYRTDTLNVFSPTTSSQLRGLISDETGGGVLVFNNSPSFIDAIGTSSTTFALLNSNVTTVTAFQTTTSLSIGATTGTTTIRHDFLAEANVTLGDDGADIITINGLVNIEDNDFTIRGTDTYPISIGRGGNSHQHNTRVGVDALQGNNAGTQNTAFGFIALEDNNDGNGNTGIGYRSGRNITDGSINTLLGRDTALNLSVGEGNVAIGANALASSTGGSYNVCIGAYAGFAAMGSGNVLIGPASNQNAGDVTYLPPLETGDNQLVIGSGPNAWLRGTNTFDVTIPQSLAVSGDVTIAGNLTINGVYTSVNSSVVTIDDKAIELGAVVNTTFNADVADQSNYISSINPTTGLIAGMVLTSNTSGVAVPLGTYITEITEDNAYLSEVVSVTGGTSNASFNATGPSDTSADGGGIILKGTSDKTITYSDFAATWDFSEHINVATAKEFRIGGGLALSSTTLGSTIVNSSLTSVGTLTGLSVNGPVHLGGRISERVFNSYTTTLTPSLNILTIDCANSSVIVGTTAASAINTWNFTNVNLANGQALTLTLIVDSNTVATYGDACAVDTISVTNGIRWQGGSPPSPSPNEDILTFVIVKDVGGVTRVYGSGQTNFS